MDMHIVPGMDKTGGCANDFTVFDHRGSQLYLSQAEFMAEGHSSC
ncbi:unnamed protein product, partial [marine sediment metagenome]